ncbi:MAG: RNA 2',3'-cyclic phosphodiesterase [Crenarchaeota archaeon]|nr:RNA 2',3'-cyclic phosphodiesterase [Thermoproteota archaeon]
MNLLRVFIAVEITDEKIKKLIESIQRELLKGGVDIKPVEMENLHITLRFIGEVPQATVNEIINKLRTISYQKFKMRIKGLGAFPSPSNPRVIWAGVAEGSRELSELHEIVERLVGRYGIKDDKEFTPHLTIARVRSPRNKQYITSIIEKYRDLDFGEQEVSCIKLKRSVLTPRGPIYSDLLKVDLT